jgi:hypothetical protein
MKLAASFFSTFAGWAVSFLAMCAWLALRSGNGIQDFEFFHGWTLMVSTFGWLVAGWPFVTRLGAESRWRRFPRSALAGGALSLLVYSVTLGWSLWPKPWLFLFAFSVGAVALPVCVAIERRFGGLAGQPRANAAAALLLAPIALYFGFSELAWPALERFAPSFAYRMGSDAVRGAMRGRMLRSIQPGARLDELRRRFPDTFSPDTRRLTTSYSDTTVTIVFEAGRVTFVLREARPAR